MSKFQKKTEIIFDGTKRFQDSEIDVNLLLVNHIDNYCLEVIAKLDNRIVRYYLDMKSLILLIDLTIINERFNVERSMFVQSPHATFDCAKSMKGIAMGMIADIVFERLDVDKKQSILFLKPCSTDKTNTFILKNKSMQIYDFELYERPHQLIPYNISTHESFTLRFRAFETSSASSSPNSKKSSTSTSEKKSTKSVSFKHPIASWSVDDEECVPFSDTASNCSSWGSSSHSVESCSDDGSCLASTSSDFCTQEADRQTAVPIYGPKQLVSTTEKKVEQQVLLKLKETSPQPVLTTHTLVPRHSWSSTLFKMLTSSVVRRGGEALVPPPPPPVQ